MSRKDDTQVLVRSPISKNSISQKALIACLLLGITLVSLLIYGFISALDLKSNHGDPLESATDTEIVTDPVCPAIEFDYLLLAIRWPLSDCTEDQCVADVPSRWLVHGLWPNYSNGSWPQFCCPSYPFKEQQIQPLRNRLLKVWPNLLKHENASSLWGHEWNKHGTCATKNYQIRGELNYFNHTLSLFDDVDVEKWLEAGAITPGPKKIRKEAIKKLLESQFGKKVTVHCVHHGLYSSKDTATITSTTSVPLAENKTTMNLESIHFCYDKTEITAIDCQDSDNCPEEFLLPSEV